jgi:DNA-binding NtrC family response regulator
VLEAADADEATRLCREEDVAVVLSDAVLPTSSGPELIRQLRELDTSLPVALMSAHPREVLEREHGVTPTIPLLRKPFSHEDVLVLVRGLLAPGAGIVLVVEDNEAARLALSDLLTEDGHTVLSAPTVSGALDLVRQDVAIDLVLTDVTLPDGTGPELVEELRRMDDEVAAVYTSGRAPDSSLDAYIARHEAIFVQKPADLSAFTDAVSVQLRKRAGSATRRTRGQ